MAVFEGTHPAGPNECVIVDRVYLQRMNRWLNFKDDPLPNIHQVRVKFNAAMPKGRQSAGYSVIPAYSGVLIGKSHLCPSLDRLDDHSGWILRY